jgi:RND family efflux transporter MFP subunit
MAMDKKALLNELKIDRNAPPAEGTVLQRPLRWFLAVAVLGGVGFVAWFVDLPSDDGLLPVKTAVASSAVRAPAGSSVLDATGYVVARRQATVSAKVTGKVIAVYIEEGMAVERDALLARLDDSIPRAQLALAESQLSAARAGLNELDVERRQVQLDLDRTEGLARRNLASQADLDRDRLDVEALIARLERTRRDIVVAEQSVAVQRQQVMDMEIRAPFAGVVIAKAAQPGEMISPLSAGGGFTRTGICTIVDMDSLEVEVDVNEAYINRVSAEQPVQVTLNAYPDYTIPAQVIAIIPAADRNKATVRVRIELLDRDDRVLPDMGVRVAFLEEAVAEDASATVQPGVLLPATSITDDGRYVFVVSGDRAERRAVVLGDREGARIRILSGVEQGERVVAELNEELLVALTDSNGRVRLE